MNLGNAVVTVTVAMQKPIVDALYSIVRDYMRSVIVNTFHALKRKFSAKLRLNHKSRSRFGSPNVNTMQGIGVLFSVLNTPSTLCCMRNRCDSPS